MDDNKKHLHDHIKLTVGASMADDPKSWIKELEKLGRNDLLAGREELLDEAHTHAKKQAVNSS